MPAIEMPTGLFVGVGNALQATLGYDELGRVSTIIYPTPAGAQPFVVAQDFDAYGHTLAVRDAASDLVYWRLSEVDDAGRFQKEIFGNDVVTERSYFDEPPVDPGYANDPDVQRILASGCMGLECVKPPVEGSREEQQVGATRPPIDVSPTGTIGFFGTRGLKTPSQERYAELSRMLGIEVVPAHPAARERQAQGPSSAESP